MFEPCGPECVSKREKLLSCLKRTLSFIGTQIVKPFLKYLVSVLTEALRFALGWALGFLMAVTLVITTFELWWPIVVVVSKILALALKLLLALF